jgi:hypothetical protein
MSLQLGDPAGVKDLIVELTGDHDRRCNGIIIDIRDEGALVLTCAHSHTFINSLSFQCVLKTGMCLPTVRVSSLLDRTGAFIDAAIFFAFSRTAFKDVSTPRWTNAPIGINIDSHYLHLRFGGLESRLHGTFAGSYFSTDVTITTSIRQPVSISHDVAVMGSQQCVLLAEINIMPIALQSMHGCPIITNEGHILGILLGSQDTDVRNPQIFILPMACVATLMEDSRSWNATRELMYLYRISSATMREVNTTAFID